MTTMERYPDHAFNDVTAAIETCRTWFEREEREDGLARLVDRFRRRVVDRADEGLV
jgi:hypothetical protein